MTSKTQKTIFFSFLSYQVKTVAALRDFFEYSTGLSGPVNISGMVVLFKILIPLFGICLQLVSMVIYGIYGI